MSAAAPTLYGQSFWNFSCSFRPIVLKLHRWLGHLLKMCKLCPPNILRKNWWIWIIFCLHTNFLLKQWSQGLSDTDYQLPIFRLKYHIPDRDTLNFLLCPFFLQTNPSISWILQNRFFFNSNKNSCDLIPADTTSLSADFLCVFFPDSYQWFVQKTVSVFFFFIFCRFSPWHHNRNW